MENAFVESSLQKDLPKWTEDKSSSMKDNLHGVIFQASYIFKKIVLKIFFLM